MDVNPTYTFAVQKLGSEGVSKSSNSVTSLQKPLKKMYTAYQKNVSINPPLPQFKIIAGKNGMTISDAYNNVQTNSSAENNSDPNTSFNPQILKDQIILKAALQFKIIAADKKGKKFKAAFITLDQEQLIKQKKEYNSLFVNLDDKEIFLSSMINNPPLFVCVTKVNKNVDMHVFICNNDMQALNMVNVLNGIIPIQSNQTITDPAMNDVTQNGHDDNLTKKDTSNILAQTGNIVNETNNNGQPQNSVENLQPDPNMNNSQVTNFQNQQPNPNIQGMPLMQHSQNPMMGNNIYDQIPYQHMPSYSQQPNTNLPSGNYQQIYGQPYMPPYYQPYGNPYQQQPPYGPSYMPPTFPPNSVPMQQYYNPPPENIYQQFNPGNQLGMYPGNFNLNQAFNVNSKPENLESNKKNAVIEKIPRPAIISNTNSSSSSSDLIEDKFNNLNIKPNNQPIPQFTQQQLPNFANSEISQQTSQFSSPSYNVYGNPPQSAPITSSSQSTRADFNNEVQKKLSIHQEGPQPFHQPRDQPSTAPIQKKNEKIPPIPPSKKPVPNPALFNKTATNHSTSSQSEDCVSPVSSDNGETPALKVPKKVMGIQVLPIPLGGLDRQLHKKQNHPQPNANSPQETQTEIKSISPEALDGNEVKETVEEKVMNPVTEVHEVNGAENNFEKSLGYLP